MFLACPHCPHCPHCPPRLTRTTHYALLKTDRSVVPSDPSEKPIGQITNPRAISSVEAATLQIFRVFRAFRGQKMGYERQAGSAVERHYAHWIEDPLAGKFKLRRAQSVQLEDHDFVVSGF
jgi:hypothetical protein